MPNEEKKPVVTDETKEANPAAEEHDALMAEIQALRAAEAAALEAELKALKQEEADAREMKQLKEQLKALQAEESAAAVKKQEAVERKLSDQFKNRIIESRSPAEVKKLFVDAISFSKDPQVKAKVLRDYVGACKVKGINPLECFAYALNASDPREIAAMGELLKMGINPNTPNIQNQTPYEIGIRIELMKNKFVEVLPQLNAPSPVLKAQPHELARQKEFERLNKPFLDGQERARNELVYGVNSKVTPEEKLQFIKECAQVCQKQGYSPLQVFAVAPDPTNPAYGVAIELILKLNPNAPYLPNNLGQSPQAIAAGYHNNSSNDFLNVVVGHLQKQEAALAAKPPSSPQDHSGYQARINAVAQGAVPPGMVVAPRPMLTSVEMGMVNQIARKCEFQPKNLKIVGNEVEVHCHDKDLGKIMNLAEAIQKISGKPPVVEQELGGFCLKVSVSAMHQAQQANFEPAAPEVRPSIRPR